MTPTGLTREQCRQFIEEHLFTPKTLTTASQESDAIGSIGMELEIFPYVRNPDHPFGVAPVKLFGHEKSLVELLLHTMETYGGKGVGRKVDASKAGLITSLDKIDFPDGDLFQFEPGGQIEISTAPCASVPEVKSHLDHKISLLRQFTAKHDIHFAQFGTNPWFAVQEIGNQLNKPRYKGLEGYFDQIGPYGKQMMLQTGSLHINVDLGADPITRAKRIMAANLLVPIVTAMFAHSPIIAGKRTSHNAHRSFLWQNLDHARTGILPVGKWASNLDLDQCIDAYLEKALQAPVIYIRALDNRIFPINVTMEYWMEHGVEGVWPTLDDFGNQVSLLFPEVRVKGYLEIRSVDAPPSGWEMVPVIFYCGLLYAGDYLDRTLEIMLPHIARMQELFESATLGLASDELFSLCKQLYLLAEEGFEQLPVRFRGQSHERAVSQFYDQYLSRRRTFADGQIESFYATHNPLS